MQALLDELLGRFETRFFRFHEELDRLLSLQTPGEKQAKKLKNDFPQNGITLGYFFEKATSGWLVPLREKEFFHSPPVPDHDQESGTVGFPVWPASRYLVRIAREDPSCAQLVAATSLEIPTTENTRVHEDVADVACALPPDLASRFVEKASQWLKSPFKLFLPEKLGRLVSHLANGGEGAKAVELAQALFAVLPDPRLMLEPKSEERRLLFPEPQGHMDDHEYDQILGECREELIRAAPEGALDMFSALLDQAIRLSFPDLEPPEDHSSVWRPSIGDSESRRGSDIKDTLTTTVRNAARAVVESDVAHLPDVVVRLERFRWRVFLRIALWLIEEFPGEMADDARVRLLDRHGEVEPPSSESPHAGFLYGHRSPKGAAELSAMPTTDLVTFLKTWRPQHPWDEPGTEGLSDQLRAAASADPLRFSGEAIAFVDVPVEHVFSLLGAFEAVVREKKAGIVWGPVLELCRWVIDERDGPGFREGRGWVEWRHARLAVLRLLREGAADGPARIDGEFQAQVWEILEALSRDPDPSLEAECEALAKDTDPVQLSLHAVRAEVVTSLPAYVLWRIRDLERIGSSVLPPRLTAVNEVRGVVERLIDPKIERSLAVWSACGQRFALFAWLDEAWARELAPAVFSRDAKTAPLGEVAWEGFIVNTRPQPVLLDILREQYREAVEVLSSAPRQGKRCGDPERRLAEHIMELYWQGHLELEVSGSLLRLFYEKAPIRLRKHVMEFVGRQLRATKEDVPPEILRRLQDLWEYRFAASDESRNPTASAEELTAFGWWFSSGKFAPAWSLKQLARTFEQFRGVVTDHRADHLVAEQLEVLAPEFPEETARCLDGLVGAADPRRYIGWTDHALRILESSIASDSSVATAEARKVANRLGALEYEEFRVVAG
jgi:hypothetical protein